jgi:hypothetical protein
MPTLHIMALSLALVTGILFGRKQRTAIAVASIGLLLLYASAAVWFICDTSSDILHEAQIPKFATYSLFSFAAFWLLGFLMPALRRNAALLYRWIRLRRVYIPVLVVFGVPLLLLGAVSGWESISCRLPQVDEFVEFSPDSKRQLLETERKLGLAPLNTVDYSRFSMVTRVYRMPSFESEKLLELRIVDKEVTLLRISSFRDSLDTVNGYFCDSLRSHVGRTVVDTCHSPQLIEELLDSIQTFRPVLMKSALRKPMFECGCVTAVMDATTYLLDVKNGDRFNTFDFWDQKYDDPRYGWIAENFGRFFAGGGESWEQKGSP